MRPRISQPEAIFILKILEREKVTVETQKSELMERLKPLGATVAKAIILRSNFFVDMAVRECGWPKCLEQLNTLSADDRVLLKQIAVYKRLLNKYSLMANGKEKGRYPNGSDGVTEAITDLSRYDVLTHRFADMKTEMRPIAT
jgi:hypothetical protein